MGVRISVLVLCARIRKLRVRIRIDGYGCGQSLEFCVLLMASENYIIIYSSTLSVISQGLYDRADTSKNVHIVLPDGSIQYCVTSVL
jgi:hypothetical protein